MNRRSGLRDDNEKPRLAAPNPLPARWAAQVALPFSGFFLIIAALYHLKPATRSLFLESYGVDGLPYAWILTAVTLGLLMPLYHHLAGRVRHDLMAAGAALTLAAALLLLHRLGEGGLDWSRAALVVLVDVGSVILVEQLWSLTNSRFDGDSARRFYALVGSGGLLGGIAGGLVSAWLLRSTSLQTPDLLLVGAGLIALTAVPMARLGAGHRLEPVAGSAADWRLLTAGRYLLLLAAVLLLAQLVAPLAEYQFLKSVESAYPGRDERTAFLSMFLSLMGVVAVAINLTITRLVHRYLGAVAGLVAQPIALVVSSLAFFVQPGLSAGALLKISDRGLAYSIGRASRELLYIPIDPVRIHRAKAWIDMFGYRLFKGLGSVLVLASTQWLPASLGAGALSWIIVAICLAWLAVIAALRAEYCLRVSGLPGCDRRTPA